ncbi:MAG: hypothetical protein Q4C96_01245 [Planctomycetia bacterium]|nr:hypothetical protein [Planctomycetia bacterium]
MGSVVTVHAAHAGAALTKLGIRIMIETKNKPSKFFIMSLLKIIKVEICVHANFAWINYRVLTISYPTHYKISLHRHFASLKMPALRTAQNGNVKWKQ